MDTTPAPEPNTKSPALAGLLGFVLGGFGLFYLSAAHGVTWLTLHILSLSFDYPPLFLVLWPLAGVFAVLCLKFPHYFSFMDRINTFLGNTLSRRTGTGLAILIAALMIANTVLGLRHKPEPLHSKWVMVSASEGITFYVDRHSIRGSGRMRQALTLSNYPDGRADDDSQSSETSVMVDCLNRDIAILSGTTYDAPYGQGNVITSYALPELMQALIRKRADPESMAGGIVDFVCSR